MMFFNISSFGLIVFFIPFSMGVLVCPTFKDYFFPKLNKRCYDNPDGEAENPGVIIRRHGFNSKTYNITTADDYIISVERIHKKINKKTPIIIGPGISMNAFAYVNRGNKSLAFFLANNGYQVWVIDWRGTKFSRKHKYLPTNSKQFWNTGFDDMAKFDLKAVIELVFQESKNKAIYLGYSMGTTIGLIANIKEPEISEKTLKGMVHLAPVATFNHSKSIARYLNRFWPLARPFIFYLGQGVIRFFIEDKNYCASHPFKMIFCELLILPVYGNGIKLLDPLTHPVASNLNRDVITIKTVDHYYQIIKRHSFVEFSHGKLGNIIEYQSIESPKYDLEKVTLPQFFLVGERDILATPKDAKNLYDNLPTSSKCGYAIIEEYQHRDFVGAKNVQDVLFVEVLESINRIDKGYCNG